MRSRGLFSSLVSSLTVLALLPVSPVRAQVTCTAEGVVLDQEGNPLPGVKVLLEYKGHVPQKYRTKTDQNGKFVHVNVYEGTYDLTFTAEGLGEVTVKDFPIREIAPLEKAPTFRIGTTRKAAAPPAAGADATAAGGAPPPPALDLAVLAAELQKGNDALAGGRVDEAITAYETLLGQAPGIAQVQHNLGLAYRKKGDAAKAEAAFRKAAQLKPDFAEPHGALSVMLAGAGKGSEAIAEAAKAAELAPQNAQYAYNLGILLKDMGKSGEAQEALLKAEALDPSNAEIQFHLGTVLLGLGQIPDAVARLEKYLAQAPADAPNVAAARGIIAAVQKKTGR